jgi:hypothetical protein
VRSTASPCRINAARTPANAPPQGFRLASRSPLALARQPTPFACSKHRCGSLGLAHTCSFSRCTHAPPAVFPASSCLAGALATQPPLTRAALSSTPLPPARIPAMRRQVETVTPSPPERTHASPCSCASKASAQQVPSSQHHAYVFAALRPHGSQATLAALAQRLPGLGCLPARVINALIPLQLVPPSRQRSWLARKVRCAALAPQSRTPAS